MNKRMIIIAVLLVYLLCFHCVLQAQQEYRWRALSALISDNGRYLAVKHKSREWIDDTSDYDRGIWIYDMENLLSPPQYLSEAQKHPASIGYSPNSEYFAVGGYNRLTVFNIENNAVILDLPSSATPIHSEFSLFSFSPDSNYIMSFSNWWEMEHEISIWDVHTGQRIHAIAISQDQQWDNRPWLSPDWRQFFNWTTTTTEMDTVYEFDVEQEIGQQLGSIFSNGISARPEVGALFSPDSSFFALARWDGEVLVYETDTWTLKNSISLHRSPCGEGGVSLAFAHNHPWLAATCGWDGTLSVWNYETNNLVFRDETFLTGVPRFTRDDAFLITSRSSDSPEKFSISVWNTKKDFELTQYPGVTPRLHPNSEIMTSIGPDSRVWIWNIKQDQLLMILPVPRASDSGSRRFSG